MQLAKEYGLNQPNQKNKDKLKLWYLLYVLDGQQSLTFNRQPLLNSQEYSLKHSKELLLGEKGNKLSDLKSKELIKTKQIKFQTIDRRGNIQINGKTKINGYEISFTS